MAVPGNVAQEVANELVESGVQAILNFSPTVLQVPDQVMVHAVDLALDDLGTSDAQFVALASHVLEEHAQVQQAATGDVELLARRAWLHTQCNVAPEFLVESLRELS